MTTTLWPSKLTASEIGGPNCETHDMQTLSTAALGLSGCIWSGYSTIEQAFKERHFRERTALSVDDGVLKRDFTTRAYPEVAETWVLGSHMAAGVLSKIVANSWYQALQGIPVSSWHHPLRYRSFNQTIGSFQIWAPAVRTRCGINTSLFQNSSGLQQEVWFPSSTPISLPHYSGANLSQVP